MNCCTSKSRPSLAERINSIVNKYEYQRRCTPLEKCPGPLPSYLRKCPSIPCNSRPVSAPKSFCEPRSLPACHQYIPCKKSKSYRPTSSPSYEFIPTHKYYSPATAATNIPPYPGPNLQRYLSKKNICPSLKGRLMLYNNCYESELPPTYRPTSSSPGVVPRCPPPPLRPPTLPTTSPILTFCRCSKAGYPRQSRLFRCEDRVPSFRCDITCPTRQRHQPLKHNKRVLSPTLRMSGLNASSYEPPFSSPQLEREFTSRFVKVPVNYCTDYAGTSTICPQRYVC